MIKNIEEYVESYILFDDFVEYKGLKIYQFKVIESIKLRKLINILLIDKNKETDVKILQMSYLQFITTVLFQFNKTWTYKFYDLLTHVFKCNNEDILVLVNKKGKVFLRVQNVKCEIEAKEFDEIKDIILKSKEFDRIKDIYDFKKVDITKKNDKIKDVYKMEDISTLRDIDIKAKEFDEIKDIILFSNVNGYDNKYVNPEMEKLLERYNRASNKNMIAPTLEKKIHFIMSEVNISKKDILQMSYLEMEKLYNLMIDKLEYKINKTAEMIGNVKFKEAIQNPLYEAKKDKYANMIKNVDDLKEKINSIQ